METVGGPDAKKARWSPTSFGAANGANGLAANASASANRDAFANYGYGPQAGMAQNGFANSSCANSSFANDHSSRCLAPTMASARRAGNLVNCVGRKAGGTTPQGCATRRRTSRHAHHMTLASRCSTTRSVTPAA